MHTQLLVLGGGPGGYTAAFAAADRGMDVTLVEQKPQLGGECLLRGCIPSKALLHVSRVISEASAMDAWGVNFPTPTIDLERMRARKQKVIKTLSDGLGQLAKRRKVRVIQARGVFESSDRIRLDTDDPELADGVSFERCILAVGSRPVTPEALALPGDRVMDSAAALELQDAPKRLLVVGGGYIGLELGTVYAELGSKVTVVEMTDGLLPGVDRDLVKPLHKRLQGLLEDIRPGTQVSRLEQASDERVLATLSHDGEEETQAFDRVLVAVGRQPNSEELGLENTEVKCDERGFVIVDQQMRTADPRILAVGDVCGEPMLAHKATHQAKVAIGMISGESVTFGSAAIPAVVFTDPEIAWAGLTQEAAKAEGREVQVGVYPWAASGRAHAVGRTEGMTKLIIDPQSQRILGMGIVGAGAGELIAEGVLAIETGATVKDVVAAIHPHPTLSETIPLAGESYLGVATEIYRPRRNR